MSDDFMPIQRALISVSNKEGLESLARSLVNRKVEIISSGGTSRFLLEKGIPTTEISDFTGSAEMLDGRIKTLHPKIHAGLLAIRNNSAHMKQLAEREYLPIDLVIVNLYPFEDFAKNSQNTFSAVVEQIDIGGPTLLRAAAKNFPFVTVLVEPSQYEEFLHQLDTFEGKTSLAYRRQLAQRVFERTQAYDSVIARFFQKDQNELPGHLPVSLQRKWDLRYGENPHQKATFYLPAEAQGDTIVKHILQGKTLSHNNLLDIHAALDLMLEFSSDFVTAILKHTTPCGVGISETSLSESYDRALQCDPVSAFGGIVALSHPLDQQTAEKVSQTFTEIVIAPMFSQASLDVFSKKKNVRLLQMDMNQARMALAGHDIRRAGDGYVVQDHDCSMEDLAKSTVVSKRSPTAVEYKALTLAWKVAKHVKSNAIVVANAFQTIGIGAGQTSRIDACKIAVGKAGTNDLKGAALASDAFFPFRDNIDEAARVGITAIVQPGGSLRDEEVVTAADQHNVAMVFTHVRHFRH